MAASPGSEESGSPRRSQPVLAAFAIPSAVLCCLGLGFLFKGWGVCRYAQGSFAFDACTSPPGDALRWRICDSSVSFTLDGWVSIQGSTENGTVVIRLHENEGNVSVGEDLERLRSAVDMVGDFSGLQVAAALGLVAVLLNIMTAVLAFFDHGCHGYFDVALIVVRCTAALGASFVSGFWSVGDKMNPHKAVNVTTLGLRLLFPPSEDTGWLVGSWLCAAAIFAVAVLVGFAETCVLLTHPALPTHRRISVPPSPSDLTQSDPDDETPSRHADADF